MSPLLALNVPEKLRNSLKDEAFHVLYNESAAELEIFLTGVVGDEYTESDAASIAKLLSQHRGKPVTMRINSMGGLAFDGLAIHNALAMHDAPTKAIIEGVAASAASLAALGANRVVMHANATYHIHEGLAFGFGHVADLQETIAWLESFNEAAVVTYAAKTGVSLGDVRKALLGKHGDGTQYTADEAKKFGFVDEVIPLKTKSTKADAGRDLQAMLNYRIASHWRDKMEAALTARKTMR